MVVSDQDLDWTHVRSFLATVENGSLSGAARALGLTQPTLGRHIQELEATLGVTLFLRYQKGLEPTEAGRTLVETARAMRAAAESFEQEARGRMPPLEGVLRIAAAGLLSADLVAVAALLVRDRAPGVELEIAPMPPAGLPSAREADVALLADRPSNPDLDLRRLGVFPIAIYAAESYWRAVGGRPAGPEGLRLADLVGPDRLIDSIRPAAAAGLPVFREDCRLRTDDPAMMMALLRAGAGFAPLPQAVGEAQAGLVRLDLPLRIPSQEIWAAIPSSGPRSRKAQRVLDVGLDALADAALHLPLGRAVAAGRASAA